MSALLGIFTIGMSCILPIMMMVFVAIAWGITIYLIMDVFKRDFGKDENMAMISVLLLIFGGFPVGSLIYYFMVMQKYPLKPTDTPDSKN